MANPYHDEQGRFTSGPGAGQVGKGAIVKWGGGRVGRVEAQWGDELVVSGPSTDRFGKPTYGGMHRMIDPKSIESVESLKARPVKISGRGDRGKSEPVTTKLVQELYGGGSTSSSSDIRHLPLHMQKRITASREASGIKEIRGGLPKGAKPIIVKGYND